MCFDFLYNVCLKYSSFYIKCVLWFSLQICLKYSSFYIKCVLWFSLQICLKYSSFYIKCVLWFSLQFCLKYSSFYIKCVLWFSLRLSEIFLILRIERDIITHVHWSSCKVQVLYLYRYCRVQYLYSTVQYLYSTCFYCGISKKLEFYEQNLEKTQISNFVIIRPVAAKLFHAGGLADRQTDRQTGRHKEPNSCFL